MKNLIFSLWMMVGSSGFLLAIEVNEKGESSTQSTAAPTSAKKKAKSFFNKRIGRDPLTPIGYVKPSPQALLENATKKPEVVFTLKVAHINLLGEIRLATLSNGQVIEVGEKYEYHAPGNVHENVFYRVIQITEDQVMIEYNGRQLSFTCKPILLEDFTEKE